jgi:hypothetical protein
MGNLWGTPPPNLKVNEDDKILFHMPNFSKYPYVQETGGDLKLPLTLGLNAQVLVRAERCTTEEFSRDAWFAAVRTELREQLAKDKGLGEWYRSVLFVNNSIKLPRVKDSLIVCDGDVELSIGIDRSVIIANGDIYTERGTGYNCYFAAAGKISFPMSKFASHNMYHSGNNVTLIDKPAQSERIRENQRSLPFGVKFLDPREFGLELAVQNGGIQVIELGKDSPFAKYGVQEEDVISSIDNISASSIATFRRQLRKGIVTGYVTLRIRRGNISISRIVFLDGIPTPTAPAPREINTRVP